MRSAIAAAADRLAAAGVPSPQVDAIALAEHALGVDQLILAVPPAVPDGFEPRYADLVRRRESREPLQQIVGYAAFRQLRVRVTRGVFLPRPETEVVAQAAIDEARRLVAGESRSLVLDLRSGSGVQPLGVDQRSTSGDQPLVVDLCSGSGVIALSVIVEAPGSRVIAIDLDPAAVSLARSNAAEILAPAQQGAIRFEVGDVTDAGLLADLDGTADVVISNPPYIPDDAVPVDPEVTEHDPPGALFGGGADGLNLPSRVIAAAARLLRGGGLFVMEHADVQGPAVRDLVDHTNAFEPATTHQDLTGRDRYVQTRRRD